MQKILLSVCLLFGNLAFAGPVTKNLVKGVKAADQASKDMAAALKSKGWKTSSVFRNENIIHVDTSAGQSTLSIEANQLTGWKFNSRSYTGKEIKNDVVDESYQATGKIKSEFINGSGGFFDTFPEMEKIGRNRVAVADSHRHSALARTNGPVTDVDIGLYQYDVTL